MTRQHIRLGAVVAGVVALAPAAVAAPVTHRVTSRYNLRIGVDQPQRTGFLLVYSDHTFVLAGSVDRQCSVSGSPNPESAVQAQSILIKGTVSGRRLHSHKTLNQTTPTGGSNDFESSLDGSVSRDGGHVSGIIEYTNKSDEPGNADVGVAPYSKHCFINSANHRFTGTRRR